MTAARILIAGIGNIFLGDDAFGVEVARKLSTRPQPEDVRVVDFGIRGLDLAYALLDKYEAVILVDALPRGGAPGTLYVLEPDTAEASETEGSGLIEAHSMDPEKVLRMVEAMGGQVERLLVVGCEPEPLGASDDMRDGLSAPVAGALDKAVALVESLAARLLRGESLEGGGDWSVPEAEVTPCRD